LPEIKYWIEFCRSSKRGLTGLGGILSDTNLHNDRYLEEEVEEIIEFTGTTV